VTFRTIRLIQYLSTEILADINIFRPIRPLVHYDLQQCDLPAMITQVWKAYRTDVGQMIQIQTRQLKSWGESVTHMQRRKHHMATRSLQLSIFSEQHSSVVCIVTLFVTLRRTTVFAQCPLNL